MLKCGLHKCPSKCHQIYDHSKILCNEILTLKCSNGHDQRWKCYESAPLSCRKCDQEEKDRKEKQIKAFEEKQRRERAQNEYTKRMAKFDEEIERVQQDRRDARLNEDRRKALDQKQKDLAEAKQQLIDSLKATGVLEQARQTIDDSLQTKSTQKIASPGEKAPPQASPDRVIDTSDRSAQQPLRESLANIEWQRQKEMENASNRAIDDIMAMTGLEAVKTQVLKIKAKVDTCIRQNSGFNDERFGVVLLGNPGTGEISLYATL